MRALYRRLRSVARELDDPDTKLLLMGAVLGFGVWAIQFLWGLQ